MAGINLFPVGANLLAQRVFSANRLAITDSLIRLATGSRINFGSDDPAGLIASENLQATLATLDAEAQSLQRADNVAAVADGGLAVASDLLAEANALVVAKANDAGLSPEEKAANQAQIDSILSTVDRIAGSTTFSSDPLLDGTATITAGDASFDIDSALTTDIGETEIDGTTYTLSDIGSGGDLNTVDGDLDGAQQVLQQAMNDLATQRGSLGSFQKYTIGSALENNRESFINIASANAQIRDTDYASEIVALNRAMVLEQASMSALVFLSSSQSSILNLLA